MESTAPFLLLSALPHWKGTARTIDNRGSLEKRRCPAQRCGGLIEALLRLLVMLVVGNEQIGSICCEGGTESVRLAKAKGGSRDQIGS